MRHAAGRQEEAERLPLNRTIALLTDFGLRDPYVGVMKGVILSVHPAARIVDLSHDIASQDVTAAYFFLENSYRYFPPGTLFVAVVDPGVGTERAVIGVEAGGRLFLAPDNGILGFLERLEKIRRIVRIDDPKYFLHPVSNTFQGRDIFAPVAAHLSRGVDLGRMGRETRSLVRLSVSVPRSDRGKIVGEVISVDRFGNLVTNIPADRVPRIRPVRVFVAKKCVGEVCETYGSRKPGRTLAYFGSGGSLEIAVNLGNAARELGVGVGTTVTVRP